MDSNLDLGEFLLPKVVSLLTVIVQIPDNTNHPPKIGCSDYDLGLLSTTDQIAWLKTMQIIMYKVKISICLKYITNGQL